MIQLLIIMPFLSTASVKLPSFFSDGMVLQQNSKAAIWGISTPGTTVKLVTSWSASFYEVKSKEDGSWKILVSTPKASKKKYSISISDGDELIIEDVLIGEVWLASGQSNMEMPLAGFPNQPVNNSDAAIGQPANSNIRFFNMGNRAWAKPNAECNKGRWAAASKTTRPKFSATAYFFAKELYDKLDVPIGILEADFGGTDIRAWMSSEVLKAFPDIKVKAEADSAYKNRNEPAGLFNGMIFPLLGYHIKGTIWYQGEHNRGEPGHYSRLFPAMVEQWRTDWGIGNFPFYYVQIAPYFFKSESVPTAVQKIEPLIPSFREVQAHAVNTIPNAGIAILTDAGSAATVHPPDKEVAGKRLSLLALAKTYGYQNVHFSGPVYKGMKKTGKAILLMFEYSDGLYFKNGNSRNFEIAGADLIFHPADAMITQEGIRVSSPDVTTPVVVRYAYKAWVSGDLYNKYDLPASSFQARLSVATPLSGTFREDAGDLQADSSEPIPGVIIAHSPARKHIYIGSPSIIRIPNGDIIASHDFFGPNPEGRINGQSLTCLYRSADQGNTWSKVGDIEGQFMSTLFMHRGDLYIMGVSGGFKKGNQVVIRKSKDYGVTWSTPATNTSGRLLTGSYLTAPTPVIEYNGRIWRAMEDVNGPSSVFAKRFRALMMSAPASSNLLDSSNWTVTNPLAYDTSYLNGYFWGWLEGNAVAGPSGTMLNILRVHTFSQNHERVAHVTVSKDGRVATFNPDKNFIDMPGGAKKFSIRYDSISRKYWTLANYVPKDFLNLYPLHKVRNTVALCSSEDLVTWKVNSIIIQHRDFYSHGYQYIDWQFDGKDIIAVSRTAEDDKEEKAANYHDANYLTFHRVVDFRNIK